MKLLEYFEGKPRFFSWALSITFANVIVGFTLLCFSSIEQFFGENQWLFYTLFFGPLGLIMLLFCILIIIGTIDALHNEYILLRSKGTALPTTIWHLLKILVLVILRVIAELLCLL